RQPGVRSSVNLGDLKPLRFDGRDAFLLLGGFVGVVLLCTLLSIHAHVDVPKGAIKVGICGMLVLPLLRRKLFGQPAARTPREGILWSLLSMVSLFLMLAAFVAALLAAVSVYGTFESPELWSQVAWSSTFAIGFGALGYLGLEARFRQPL